MQVVIKLHRRTSEKYRFLMYVRRAVAWPIRKGIAAGHHILTVYMLTGIEVAIEYMLGLTYSPQVHSIDNELESEDCGTKEVWSHIVRGHHEEGSNMCAELRWQTCQVWVCRTVLDVVGDLTPYKPAGSAAQAA